MGYAFLSSVLDGALSQDDVVKEFERERTIDGAPPAGVTLPNVIKFDTRQVLANEATAEAFLQQHTDGSSLLAVKFTDVKVEVAVPLTINGAPFPYDTPLPMQMFGRYPIAVVDPAVNGVQIADQVPQKSKRLVLKLATALHTAESELHRIKGLTEGHASKILSPKDEVNWTALKTCRKKMISTYASIEKARKAYAKVADPLSRDLYTTQRIDNGEKWMIGGWAATT